MVTGDECGSTGILDVIGTNTFVKHINCIWVIDFRPHFSIKGDEKVQKATERQALKEVAKPEKSHRKGKV